MGAWPGGEGSVRDCLVGFNGAPFPCFLPKHKLQTLKLGAEPWLVSAGDLSAICKMVKEYGKMKNNQPEFLSEPCSCLQFHP